MKTILRFPLLIVASILTGLSVINLWPRPSASLKETVHIKIRFLSNQDAKNQVEINELDGEYQAIPDIYVTNPPGLFSYRIEQILFVLTTNTQRVLDTVNELRFWSRYPGLRCLIIFEDKDLHINHHIESFLKQQNILCDVQGSKFKQYETRYLHMVSHAWNQNLTGIEWFAFADDDTMWFVENLLKQLRSYNSSSLIYLGNISDNLESVQYHGDRFAYGGAGILLSRSTVAMISPAIERCSIRYASVFGADEKLGRCLKDLFGIALIRNRHFHQIDHHGDLRGYLQSGLNGLISLHHMFAWWEPFPRRHAGDENHTISLMISAHENYGELYFKRYRKYNYKINQTYLLTLGYSFSIFDQILTFSDLIQIEKTWCCSVIYQRPSRNQQNNSIHWFFSEVDQEQRTRSIYQNYQKHPLSYSSNMEIRFL